MKSSRVTSIPRPSRLRLAWYLIVVRLFFTRNFQALRLANLERLPDQIEGPLIVYLNHPSYWDSMTGLLLQLKIFPERVLYSATRADRLEKAKHLRRQGHFPVEMGALGGTRQFLLDCGHLLSLPDTILSIAPDGEYRDPRLRPLELKRGLAALLARTGRVTVLPLAIEYTFWERQRPEILASFGAPIVIGDGRSRPVDEWHGLLTKALTATMDELADLNMRRESSRFQPLIYGRLGPRNLRILIDEIKALYRRAR